MDPRKILIAYFSIMLVLTTMACVPPESDTRITCATGALDASFNPGTGTAGYIGCLALQGDGKIIIGGGFTSFDGTPIKHLARLHADGSLDTSFTPAADIDDYVQSIAVQPDGKILIGGCFTVYAMHGRNYIARLNADGSLDTTFDPGMGFNHYVSCLALQNDGKIVSGGSFTSFDGYTPFKRIARLNSDGSQDISFATTGTDDYVYSAIIQSDGKIVIGGVFTVYNSIPRNRIARINSNGSIDTDFDPGSGANGYVSSLARQSDGKLVGGGDFTAYNGTPTNRILRLNPDGSLDTAYNTGTGADSRVLCIALQNDGKAVIGGAFNSLNGSLWPHIVRLNTNGGLDPLFSPGTATDSPVDRLLIQTNNRIIIGGSFTRYDGAERNQLARIR